MKITQESEWMKSQKHASVMAPDKDFNVLQTQNGNSVFFSLGTDNIFYVTREVQSTSSGWTRTDLSSQLSTGFGGTKVAVKTFAVSQNSQSLAVDLALIVTSSGQDHLYLCLGHLNTDVAWTAGAAWIKVPYDADSTRASLSIADVFLLNVPSVPGATSAEQTCIVDVWRAPGSNDSLDRYYISNSGSSGSSRWHKHLLAIDLDAGSISTCLGQRKQDQCPGIYTLGQIDGVSEIIYVPTINFFRPDRAPLPARLAIPTGASSFASALNTAGRSNLFVSGAGGLAMFPYDAQADSCTPISISSSTMVSNATELSAATAGNISSVWGINAERSLFYLSCAAGHESNPSAWSAPVTLLDTIERYAFFTNVGSGHHTLFAHVSGQNIIQLTQDPVTTSWQQREILLPATAINDMVEFNGFNTRVEILDDLGIAQAGVQVGINSTSPVSVYINDVYFVLSPTYAVTIKTDSTGAITIIQPADTLAVVCYKLTLLNSNAGTLLLNPANKALQTLAAINTSAHLCAVQITNSLATTRPLVPAKVSDADKAAAASALAQLVSIGATLPADGSRQQPVSTSTPQATYNKVALPVHDMSIAHAAGHDSVTHQCSGSTGSMPKIKVNEVRSSAAPITLPKTNGTNGDPASANGSTTTSVKPLLIHEATISDVGSFLVSAGDFFQMLGHKIASGLESLTVTVVDGVHRVFCKIGSETYHALLDCASAIAHGIEWVLNKIEVLVEDLIAWLGFLFGWGDIVRTHKVLKTMMKGYALKAVASIGQAEQAVSTAFDGIEAKLNSACGITDPGLPIGSNFSRAAGQSSPQAHWGHEHMKNNIDNSTNSFKSVVIAGVDGLMSELEALCVDEVQAVKDMINQIQEQIIKPYTQLTPLQVIKKLVGIIGDLVLKSAKNLIIKTLDIIKIVSTTAINIMDAPISIPILSPLYKIIANDDLSFMDLMCLVMAIPTTIMYKLAVEKAPFPDNSTTRQLINATSFEAFSSAVMGTPQHIQQVKKNAAVSISPQNAQIRLAIERPAPVPATPEAAASPVSHFTITTEDTEALKVLMIVAQFVKVGVSWYLTWQADVDYIKYKVLSEDRAPPNWQTGVKLSACLLASFGTIACIVPNHAVWPSVMADVVTSLAFLRTAVDGPLRQYEAYNDDIAPVIKVVLDVVALVPALGFIALEHDKPSDAVTFTGVVITRASSVMATLALSRFLEAPEDAIALLAANGAVLVSGLLGVATGGLMIAGK